MENGAQVIDGAEVYSSLPVIAPHNHITREWHPLNIPLIEGVGVQPHSAHGHGPPNFCQIGMGVNTHK